MRVGRWQISRVVETPPPVRRAEPRRGDPVAAVQEAVCAHFGIALRDLVGPSRRADLAHARHIAMWLARETTTASLPEIGRAFGGRDHTTVLYAVRKIAGFLDYPALAAEVQAVRTQLEAALWRAAAA